jgi:hypothetical protein
MNERRGPWYLLTGLVIGIGLGVLYGWVIAPRAYTVPGALRLDQKDHYRLMTALAYQSDADLVRAKARLKLLNDADPVRILVEQARRTLAGAGSESDALALMNLADALAGKPTATPLKTSSPTPVRSAPTAIPTR